MSTAASADSASSTLILESAKESKKATARIAWTGSALFGDLELSTPIGEGADEATFANLDGLAGSTTLQVKAHWLSWSPSGNDVAAQTNICGRYAVETYRCDKDDLPKEVWKKVTTGREALCEKHGATTCDRDKLPAAAQLEFDEIQHRVCASDLAELRKDPKIAMKRITCTSVGLAKRPDLRRAFDATVDYGQAYILGGKLKVGRQRFEFADAMTLDKGTSDETVFSVAGSGAVVLDDIVFASLTYEYQKSFKQGTKGERCSPIDMAGNLECRNLALGAPVKRKNSLVRFELRRFVSDKLAIALRTTYDIDDQVFGFEIPVYFLQNKDGGLAGGISAGFRDDEDVPTVVVFVSETLTLMTVP